MWQHDSYHHGLCSVKVITSFRFSLNQLTLTGLMISRVFICLLIW
uniref:Uncharacterized protein n=1 Tax=Ascaris lumbricoides TaxID=6252 RepID=A0A0M3ISS7_ASCLU